MVVLAQRKDDRAFDTVRSTNNVMDPLFVHLFNSSHVPGCHEESIKDII